MDVSMRFFSKFAIGVVCCSLLGCSSLNPFSDDSDPKTLPAKLEPFTASLTVKTLWTTKVGKAGSFAFSPAVVDEQIYAASADGRITKIDIATGQVVWRVDAKRKLTSGVAASKNLVVVVADKGVVHAYDPSGKLLWTTQLSSDVVSAPVLGSGLVVVRSVDNRIAALDALNGDKKWAVDRSLPPLTLRSAPGMVLTDKAVIVGFPGGRIASFSLSNGATLWDSVVAEPKGATELERIVDVSGNPVVFGSDVCTVAYQGRVACFDVDKGTSRWDKKISSEVGIDVDQLYVFVSEAGGAVSAFNRDGGASAWRNEKLTNRKLSAVTSFGRSAVVGDFEGKLHFLSRSDGAFIARLSIDNSPIVVAPVITKNRLIIQTNSGAVAAIAVE
jgi:outer membrane protein assembly factor BamB